jgi:hypothetical protein
VAPTLHFEADAFGAVKQAHERREGWGRVGAFRYLVDIAEIVDVVRLLTG